MYRIGCSSRNPLIVSPDHELNPSDSTLAKYYLASHLYFLLKNFCFWTHPLCDGIYIFCNLTLSDIQYLASSAEK